MPNQKDRAQQPLTPMSAEELRKLREAQLSRRKFLQRSGGAAAAAVGAGGTAVVADSALTQEDEAGTPPYEYEFQGVPDTPPEPPPQEFRAFSEDQAAIVEALTARILPGTPDDPGAREAGVVYFIDNLLYTNSGIHEATYTAGPYARSYEGDTPPEDDDEDTIWVKASEISRYGYQAPLAPLQVYEIGLQAIYDYAREEYGGAVADLSEENQDQIVWDLLDDAVPGFDQFPPSSFFHTLRRHTAEGMFSDPNYGGNRDFIGWNLVGFPGSQRAYSPEEMVTEDEPRPPQSMEGLPHFHPGVTSPDDHHNVVQPVREDEEDEGQPNGGPVPDVNQDDEQSRIGVKRS